MPNLDDDERSYPSQQQIALELWRELGGDAELAGLEIVGPRHVLPAAFDVTGLASASIGVAQRASSLLLARRTGDTPRPASVNSRHACAAFLCDQLFEPAGWSLPSAWDPLAGNYRTADGWIRLHTNYRYHRAAAESVLGASDRDTVSTVLAHEKSAAIETAIVDAGGCAAAMHDRGSWLETPAGAATAFEPVLRIQHQPIAGVPGPWAFSKESPRQPFEGLRVLDLTRVIAGPVATRFLAGNGADVLRIDPRGFEEVAALLPETTVGKRTTMLDLTVTADRLTFERLLRTADVLVHGLRPGALSKLGYGADSLPSINPNLITASLNAYGWSGPWQSRRGFDSLVQMSSGIASFGATVSDRPDPQPLPAQALDHATGYILAAAVAHAVDLLVRDGAVSDIRCSLTGTANFLFRCPVPSAVSIIGPTWGPSDTIAVKTGWGRARQVLPAGHIEGVPQRWPVPAGQLGRHAARWTLEPTRSRQT